MKPRFVDRGIHGRAVHQDNAAARRLAEALARKVETEKMMREVGKASPRPLARLVQEATA